MHECPHTLLEPPSPTYSRGTVRRAMAVWLHCGQRNSFRAVCDYYHRLEALEDQLPEDRRALSRHPEMDLFTHQPPSSDYLKQNYPRLYVQLQTQADRHCLQKLAAVKLEHDFDAGSCHKINVNQGNEAIMNPRSNGSNVGKSDRDNGATKQEIVETSQMIGNFCKNSKMALNTFLAGFKEHAMRCELKDTVLNVGFYIKRKMIHDEMVKQAALSNFPDLKKVNSSQKYLEHVEKQSLVRNLNETVKNINKSSTYAEAIKYEEKDKPENSRKNSKVLETSVEVRVRSLDSLKINNKENKPVANVSSPIRLLKRENANLNGKTGFQNNFGNNDILKFRKI